MALIDDVKARIPDQKLRELTNPNSPDATSIDDTVLNTAITDTKAMFRTHAGVTYDGDDDRHVMTATQLVPMVLQLYTVPEAQFQERLWSQMVGTPGAPGLLRQLARVTSRSRVTPESTSERTASPDKPEGVSKLRPDFDREHFRPLLMNPPHGAHNRNDAEDRRR